MVNTSIGGPGNCFLETYLKGEGSIITINSEIFSKNLFIGQPKTAIASLTLDSVDACGEGCNVNFIGTIDSMNFTNDVHFKNVDFGNQNCWLHVPDNKIVEIESATNTNNADSANAGFDFRHGRGTLVIKGDHKEPQELDVSFINAENARISLASDTIIKHTEIANVREIEVKDNVNLVFDVPKIITFPGNIELGSESYITIRKPIIISGNLTYGGTLHAEEDVILHGNHKFDEIFVGSAEKPASLKFRFDQDGEFLSNSAGPITFNNQLSKVGILYDGDNDGNIVINNDIVPTKGRGGIGINTKKPNVTLTINGPANLGVSGDCLPIVKFKGPGNAIINTNIFTNFIAMGNAGINQTLGTKTCNGIVQGSDRNLLRFYQNTENLVFNNDTTINDIDFNNKTATISLGRNIGLRACNIINGTEGGKIDFGTTIQESGTLKITPTSSDENGAILDVGFLHPELGTLMVGTNNLYINNIEVGNINHIIVRPDVTIISNVDNIEYVGTVEFDPTSTFLMKKPGRFSGNVEGGGKLDIKATTALVGNNIDFGHIQIGDTYAPSTLEYILTDSNNSILNDERETINFAHPKSTISIINNEPLSFTVNIGNPLLATGTNGIVEVISTTTDSMTKLTGGPIGTSGNCINEFCILGDGGVLVETPIFANNINIGNEYVMETGDTQSVAFNASINKCAVNNITFYKNVKNISFNGSTATFTSVNFNNKEALVTIDNEQIFTVGGIENGGITGKLDFENLKGVLTIVDGGSGLVDVNVINANNATLNTETNVILTNPGLCGIGTIHVADGQELTSNIIDSANFVSNITIGDNSKFIVKEPAVISGELSSNSGKFVVEADTRFNDTSARTFVPIDIVSTNNNQVTATMDATINDLVINSEVTFITNNTVLALENTSDSGKNISLRNNLAPTIDLDNGVKTGKINVNSTNPNGSITIDGGSIGATYTNGYFDNVEFTGAGDTLVNTTIYAKNILLGSTESEDIVGKVTLNNVSCEGPPNIIVNASIDNLTLNEGAALTNVDLNSRIIKIDIASGKTLSIKNLNDAKNATISFNGDGEFKVSSEINTLGTLAISGDVKLSSGNHKIQNINGTEGGVLKISDSSNLKSDKISGPIDMRFESAKSVINAKIDNINDIHVNESKITLEGELVARDIIVDRSNISLDNNARANSLNLYNGSIANINKDTHISMTIDASNSIFILNDNILTNDRDIKLQNDISLILKPGGYIKLTDGANIDFTNASVNVEVNTTDPQDVIGKTYPIFSIPSNVNLKEQGHTLVIKDSNTGVSWSPSGIFSMIATVPAEVSAPHEGITNVPVEVAVPQQVVANLPTEVAAQHEVITNVPAEVAVPQEVIANVPTEVSAQHEVITNVPAEVAVPQEVIANVPAEVAVPQEVIANVPTEVAVPQEVIANVPTEVAAQHQAQQIDDVPTLTKSTPLPISTAQLQGLGETLANTLQNVPTTESLQVINKLENTVQASTDTIKSSQINFSTIEVISYILHDANCYINNLRLNGNSDLIDNIETNNLQGASAGDDCNMCTDLGDRRNYGLWVSPFYVQGNQKSRQQNPGFRLKAGGGLVGLDHMFNDEFLVGIALGYVDSDIKYKNAKTGDKVNIKSFITTLYGRQELPANFFVQGILNSAWNKILNKDIRGMDSTGYSLSRGKHRGYGINAQAEIGYNKVIGDKAIIAPTIGLNYGHIVENKYTDKGSLYNLNYTKQKNNKIEVLANVIASCNIERGNNIITPSISAGVRHDMRGKKFKPNVRIEGNIVDFPTKAIKPTKTSYNVGTNIAINNGNTGLNFGVGISCTMAKKYRSYQATVKLGYSF